MDSCPFGCLLQSGGLHQQSESAAMHRPSRPHLPYVTLPTGHQARPHGNGEGFAAAEQAGALGYQ